MREQSVRRKEINQAETKALQEARIEERVKFAKTRARIESERRLERFKARSQIAPTIMAGLKGLSKRATPSTALIKTKKRKTFVKKRKSKTTTKKRKVKKRKTPGKSFTVKFN